MIEYFVDAGLSTYPTTRRDKLGTLRIFNSLPHRTVTRREVGKDEVASIRIISVSAVTDRFEVVDVLDNGLGQEKPTDEVDIIGRRSSRCPQDNGNRSRIHANFEGLFDDQEVLLVSCFLSQLHARQARAIIHHGFVFHSLSLAFF